MSKTKMDELIDEMRGQMFGTGHYSARCGECGYEQDVEPDADYPCPECSEGRLQSALIKMGMI